jgi:hypothetical protein
MTTSNFIVLNWNTYELQKLSSFRSIVTWSRVVDVSRWVVLEFATCLASIEAGHPLNLEFPADARREILSMSLLSNDSDVWNDGYWRKYEHWSGSL